MADVQYSNVIAHLLQVLPDIRQLYEKRSAELYADCNPHVVYGSILVEYIDSIANGLVGPNHALNDQRLKEAFQLIEELSASSDFESRCLAETSVLEALLGEKGGLERFAPYMRSETKKLARGVAQSWGLNAELLS